MYEEGWGSEMGFPGIRLDDTAGKVYGYVYSSYELAQLWSELDEFEGDAYRRVHTSVPLEDTKEEIEAFIYTLK